MPEFLELLPPAQALSLLLNNLPTAHPNTETVLTSLALGRVTASAVISPEPLPAFSRSTVDGYAVRAMDTFGASETMPAYLSLVGEAPMGKKPEFSVESGQGVLIHTGGMLPAGADAVLMLEFSQVSRPGEIEIQRAVAPGENIVSAGEDVATGQEIIPKGIRLRPSEIGGLMALGISQVNVCQPPRVAILSSGDEIVPPDMTPGPGQVRDINTYTLSALISQHGGKPIPYGIIPDRQDLLESTLQQALADCDMVVITAGSSASQRDLTSTAIQAMGSPGVLVHGVNIRPGKPTILGVCGQKPVIGLPGNPVSALVIAGLFVVPVLEHLLGIPSGQPRPQVTAQLKVNLSSQAGREDWVPVKLEYQHGVFYADPVFYKSNLIFSLVRADGLAFIPAPANGLAVGDWVQVFFI